MVDYCIENPEEEECKNKCESCIGWFTGFIGGDRCLAQPLLEYKLFGLIPIRSAMTHDNFCPVILGMVTLILVLLILTAYSKREIIKGWFK
jgi:hypothetical protein